MSSEKQVTNELRQVFRACRSYFATAAVFSFCINLLYLSSPLYMLQIYDRVIASSSQLTLVMLTLVLLLALAALAGLDAARAMVLVRASVRLDRLIAPRIITAAIATNTALLGAKSQYLRDFDNFKQAITGSGIHAVFDLPWTPIYLIVIFMLHPALGAFATGCAAILLAMAVANEWLVRAPLKKAQAAAAQNYSFTEMSLRNAEVIRAMGMSGGLLKRWSRDRNKMVGRQSLASDRAAIIQSVIRFFRLAMQSVILALGAYLVIEKLTTTGAMFAASILLGRALQPLEQVVGSWRSLDTARTAFSRIERLLLSAPPATNTKLALPRPLGKVTAEALTSISADNKRPILRGVSFSANQGDVIGFIGPSGAGKSTLARHIVGILRPASGVVRLDGADVSTWPRDSLGRYIGYLPQDIELFSDTVSANIGRFQLAEDTAVLEAATLAGVHEMILRLPQGYDTHIGEGGAILSGGMRQRIALARAVFGAPSLVILDEPNSNLDADGDAALADCVLHLKSRGTTVIIISHRPGILNLVDKVLFMKDGALEMFGPREDVISRLTRKTSAISNSAAR